MVWTPRATVAAVIEREGAFLLVEEDTDDGIRLNQPAGHLEPGESLADAAAREAREETAFDFRPTGWLGAYLWHPTGVQHRMPNYLRFAFVGEASAAPIPGRALDDGIRRALWLGVDELRARTAELRSPLVLQCVEDYLAMRDGRRPLLPLEALYTHPSIPGAGYGR